MKRKVRVVVIGAGRMGKRHAANVHSHSATMLAGVFDACPMAAAAVAQTTGCCVYPSLEEALDCADAAVVATPTPTHCDAVLAALGKGLAVLCEKPLSLNPDEV